MKTYREELHFYCNNKRELCNITKEVEEVLKKSKIEEGLLLINAKSTTASVFINDDDSGLLKDYEYWLEQLAPECPEVPYSHKGSKKNADAHLKRNLMGRETVIAITKGELDLGVWEQIFYYEFDGNRDKRVLIKIMGI